MRLKNGRLRRIFELAFCMVLFCGCGGAETETAGEAAGGQKKRRRQEYLRESASGERKR